MLRVAYVVGRYPSVSQTFILREVRALRDVGVEVQTISVNRSGRDHLLARAEREEFASTIAVRPVSARVLLRALFRAALRRPGGLARAAAWALTQAPAGLRSRVWQLFYVLESVIVWDHCDRAAIRHLHAHHLNQAADVALLACRIGGRPDWRWSVTVHGPDHLADVSRFGLVTKLSDADAVICISDFCRSQVMWHLPPEQWGKLRVIHCGVDPARYTPSARSRAPGRDGDRGCDDFRILSVGRLVAAKGHAVLLDALARLRGAGVPASAVIVGDGPDRSRLERRARALGLADVVTFAGAVGQDDLVAQYADADAFCLASLAEGVPVVLMEAMSMELPVVTTQLMGIPELVEDDVGGLLVPPGRDDVLADALRRLAADPGLRRRLGAAGRAKVLREFDASVQGLAVRGMLEEVARS